MAFGAPLDAQTPPLPDRHPPGDERRTVPLATLATWAGGVWLSLLDRDGSYFGRLGEEGIFQRFNPLMDDEYGLDIRTGLFTPAEDARWAQTGNGLRVAGASISHPHILNLIDWRQEIAVAGPVDLTAAYRRERSLTARRDYPVIGVRWREVLGSSWAATVSMGIHFFKPSADVELTLSRTVARDGGVIWDLEVAGAALDAFNNVIFNSLGVKEEEVEAHFDYGASPYAARATLRRTSPRWLLEVRGGASNRSEADVTFPGTGDAPFTQQERVRFGGALVEVRPKGRLSAAAHATYARADTERRFPPSHPEGFVLRETTTTAGVMQRTWLGGDLALEAQVEWARRPEERTTDLGEPVDHSDREFFGQVALVRDPLVGWTGSLGYAVDDRDAGVLAPGLTARNERLVVVGGYRFLSGFEFSGGLRWDIDDFGRNRFDGGHLRVVGRW